MADEDRDGLFAALPEQRAPVAPGGGRPRLRTAERRQVELRAVSLDQLLPGEHRARLVWAFVEGLDLAPLYARIKAVAGHAGHPPADPRLLVALWLQATLDGVGSARELDRLCREHLADQWRCGGVGMNHKSLADFRVGHGELLERLPVVAQRPPPLRGWIGGPWPPMVDGFAALLQAGVASLEAVAQDGMRVRASAGPASFRRAATLKECRRVAEARVRVLRAELAAEALGQARAARAGKGKSETAEPRASTTDPEARVMKMAGARPRAGLWPDPGSGYRPAYNVQLATDTQSGLIAAVDARGSDSGRLGPMSDRLAELYHCRPRRHLADGGYTCLADIERLEQAGSAVLAPPRACPPAPRVATGGPRDPGRDSCLPLPGDLPGVAAWRARMGTAAAKALYKLRAATAEWANAQARNRGLVRLVVRGAAKVKALALWFALAHNLARSWALARA
jgi:transposase